MPTAHHERERTLSSGARIRMAKSLCSVSRSRSSIGYLEGLKISTQGTTSILESCSVAAILSNAGLLSEDEPINTLGFRVLLALPFITLVQPYCQALGNTLPQGWVVLGNVNEVMTLYFCQMRTAIGKNPCRTRSARIHNCHFAELLPVKTLSSDLRGSRLHQPR